jgi:hypothetical protein
MAHVPTAKRRATGSSVRLPYRASGEPGNIPRYVEGTFPRDRETARRGVSVASSPATAAAPAVQLAEMDIWQSPATRKMVRTELVRA